MPGRLEEFNPYRAPDTPLSGDGHKRTLVRRLRLIELLAILSMITIPSAVLIMLLPDHPHYRLTPDRAAFRILAPAVFIVVPTAFWVVLAARPISRQVGRWWARRREGQSGAPGE